MSTFKQILDTIAQATSRRCTLVRCRRAEYTEVTIVDESGSATYGGILPILGEMCSRTTNSREKIAGIPEPHKWTMTSYRAIDENCITLSSLTKGYALTTGLTLVVHIASLLPARGSVHPGIQHILYMYCKKLGGESPDKIERSASRAFGLKLSTGSDRFARKLPPF